MRSGFQRMVLLFALFLIGCALVVSRVLTAHEVLQPYRIERTTAFVYPDEAETVAEKLDINEASAEELTALPGIGETLAARIVAYRAENGAFHDIGELREVKGVGDALLEKLTPYIFC